MKSSVTERLQDGTDSPVYNEEQTQAPSTQVPWPEQLDGQLDVTLQSSPDQPSSHLQTWASASQCP